MISCTQTRMNFKYLPLSGLFILSLSLSASFAYVMGEDDRLEANPSQAQMAAVRQTGIISIQGEELVSGLVTGANCDVVISAGHAAIHWQTIARKGWRRGELRGQGNFRFNPNPRAELAWQAMTFVSSGYERDDNIGKDEHDWSIFRLPEPALAACKNINVVRNKSDCSGDILMSGFHFDKPGTKMIDQSCSIKNTSGDGIIVHDCDSKDGSSGAPLFCRYQGRSTLLAINISGLTRKDYFDAGVYGKSGLNFNDRQHKNFAIFIGGAFHKALLKELKASRDRHSLEE